MPYKRSYRKNRKNPRKKMQILRVPGTIMTDTAYVTLKWQEQSIESPAATTLRVDLIGNGLTDPTVGGSSGTPSGFTEWLGFFRNYEIVYSKVFVSITNFQDAPMRCSIQPKIIAGGSVVNAGEQRYNKQFTVGIPDNATSTRSMSSSMNTRKLFGRSVDDQNFLGTVSANPMASWFWVLAFEMIGPSPPQLNFSLLANISFRVKFSDRIFALDT